MRYSLRTLLIVMAICCVAAAVAAVAMRQVKPSYGYGIRAQFTEYPPDDERLISWLEKQPGCFRVYVDRDADAIRIYWIMSRDLYGYPPPPRVKEHFGEFGYGKLETYDPDWMDQP